MKFKEVKKLNGKDREKKLKELKMELVKSTASSTTTGSARTKQIKKIIARILTSNKQGSEQISASSETSVSNEKGKKE